MSKKNSSSCNRIAKLPLGRNRFKPCWYCGRSPGLTDALVSISPTPFLPSVPLELNVGKKLTVGLSGNCRLGMQKEREDLHLFKKFLFHSFCRHLHGRNTSSLWLFSAPLKTSGVRDSEPGMQPLPACLKMGALIVALPAGLDPTPCSINPSGFTDQRLSRAGLGCLLSCLEQDSPSQACLAYGAG